MARRANALRYLYVKYESVSVFVFRIHFKQTGTNARLDAFLQLALAVLNPWNFFCSTRTLSNCLEATLTSAALSYWPWYWTVGPQDGNVASAPRSPPRESEFIPVRRVGNADQCVPVPTTADHGPTFSGEAYADSSRIG